MSIRYMWSVVTVSIKGYNECTAKWLQMLSSRSLIGESSSEEQQAGSCHSSSPSILPEKTATVSSRQSIVVQKGIDDPLLNDNLGRPTQLGDVQNDLVASLNGIPPLTGPDPKHFGLRQDSRFINLERYHGRYQIGVVTRHSSFERAEPT
ncbi:hypothetical protein Moror_12101 [Moniliophthora roreri MCA 2997]|uniref:Uncharacterized protein n=1 Tax=Moniliophthora roreri (strain MCA 2997) TaxID=1381753 RepID=V2XVY9_MONRO|nr:hypothetical protein Moror_12101 [Moniliophthora roreri MCA 2997]